MPLNPTVVNIAKKPLTLFSWSTLKKIWVIFSVTVFGFFFFGGIYTTGMNVYHNGFSLTSLEPLWSDVLLPMFGAGNACYFIAEEIRTTGHLPITLPERGEGFLGSFFYYVNLVRVYAVFWITKIIAPLLFTWWVGRGIFYFKYAFNWMGEGWQGNAAYFTLIAWVALLLIAGQISLYFNETQFTGAQAVKFEYRAIYGYYDLGSLLFTGFHPNSTFAENIVKKETGAFINGTNP